MRILNSLSLCLIAILTLGSCQSGTLSKATLDIDSGIWDESTRLVSSFEILDTISYYDLHLDIEHSTDYLYENIYVQIETQFPHKDAVTQVLPLDFADKKGAWYGKCGGNICDLRVVLKEKTRFDAIGMYTLTISQYSRVPDLDGIYELSLSVRASE